MLDRLKDRVVCAGDILFRSPWRVAVTECAHARSLFIQFSPFGIRVKLFVGNLSGSLQGRLILVGPDALEVRRAPRGPGCRAWLRRCPRVGRAGAWPATRTGASFRSAIRAMTAPTTPIALRNRVFISCLLLPARLLREMAFTIFPGSVRCLFSALRRFEYSSEVGSLAERGQEIADRADHLFAGEQLVVVVIGAADDDQPLGEGAASYRRRVCSTGTMPSRAPAITSRGDRTCRM